MNALYQSWHCAGVTVAAGHDTLSPPPRSQDTSSRRGVLVAAVATVAGMSLSSLFLKGSLKQQDAEQLAYVASQLGVDGVPPPGECMCQ